MKKSIVEIYALGVCFIAIVSCAISVGFALYDVLEMSAPEITLETYEYEKHQTNETFIRGWKEDKEIPPTDELTKMRIASYQIALKVNQRDALQSIIQMLIIIFINLVVFYPHWKIAKRSRETIS
jgi:hypothetical protein